jgi:hypothetical protein
MARAKAMCGLLICVFVVVLLGARSRLAQADGGRLSALDKESVNLLLDSLLVRNASSTALAAPIARSARAT